MQPANQHPSSRHLLLSHSTFWSCGSTTPRRVLFPSEWAHPCVNWQLSSFSPGTTHNLGRRQIHRRPLDEKSDSACSAACYFAAKQKATTFPLGCCWRHTDIIDELRGVGWVKIGTFCWNLYTQNKLYWHSVLNKLLTSVDSFTALTRTSPIHL